MAVIWLWGYGDGDGDGDGDYDMVMGKVLMVIWRCYGDMAVISRWGWLYGDDDDGNNIVIVNLSSYVPDVQVGHGCCC